MKGFGVPFSGAFFAETSEGVCKAQRDYELTKVYAIESIRIDQLS